MRPLWPSEVTIFLESKISENSASECSKYENEDNKTSRIQNGEIWENLPMALLLFCGQSLQVQDLLNSSLPLTWKVAMLKINLQRLQWKA